MSDWLGSRGNADDCSRQRRLRSRPRALEGSIFIAGAAVQWLRDGLKIIRRAADTAEFAKESDPDQHVYLVPAFVGLGAPHWDADARGATFGITRGTTAADFARAALESVCYQTHDLLEAMRGDWGTARGAEAVVRVDRPGPRAFGGTSPGSPNVGHH